MQYSTDDFSNAFATVIKSLEALTKISCSLAKYSQGTSDSFIYEDVARVSGMSSTAIIEETKASIKTFRPNWSVKHG